MKPRLKRLLKAIAPLLALAAVGGFAVSLLTGDGCGPVERGIRAALGTWDMWDTAMLAPYRTPSGALPEGTVPVGGAPETFERAQVALEALPAVVRARRSAQAYRRYCHHCHGPQGDNRISVGESFGFALPDLRQDAIQNLVDEQIFEALTSGSKRMIPLAATLSGLDRLLAIEHLRSLRGAESKPFFRPRWVEPAEQPGGPRG